MWAEGQKQKYNLRRPHFQRQKSCCTEYWRCHLQPGFFIECKELCHEPLVSQATPFVGRKGLVTLQPSNFCRGMQLLKIVVENKMLTSTKRDVIILHDNGRDSGSDWSHQVSAVAVTWRLLASSPGHSQILSYTRAFLHGCEIKSGSGLGMRLDGCSVACETRACCTTVYLHLSLL